MNCLQYSLITGFEHVYMRPKLNAHGSEVSGWPETPLHLHENSNQQTFIEFNTFSNSLILLVFTNICKIISLYTHKKVSLQNYKPICPVILRISKLIWHTQSFLKAVLVMFGLFSIKFLKNEKLPLRKQKTLSP